MAEAADVAQIRAFNRFYTRVIGLLGEGMHQTQHTLAEARIIYELAQVGTTTASVLATALGMDKGQMSRLIARLSAQGLIGEQQNDGDGRASPIALTQIGEAIAARFAQASNEAVERTMLDPLTAFEQADLVASMRRIETMFAEPGNAPLIVRPHRVGELGWLIHRQGLLYHLEQGWNGEFEALITRLYADYEQMEAPGRKALWIADRGGVVGGSVYVVPAEGEDDMAQLRMLYVEPMFRGQGIGRLLVDEAIGFARMSGYRRIMLWTQDCLVSARRIYQAAGFELVREERHHSFGVDLNGQYWMRQL